MTNITIIKERNATDSEVFNNLYHGGLKLLCENNSGMTISEVNWYPGGKIEIINMHNGKNPKIIGEYITDFPYKTLDEMKMNNPKMFAGKVWYIGHIED